MTASRPFALWMNGRFVVCGDNGHLGILEPADERIDQIQISDTDTPVIAVCEGSTLDVVYALTAGGVIVEVQVDEPGSQRIVWSGTRSASCVHFSSGASRLFVGTRKGEVFGVDPNNGSVTASARDDSTDSVLEIAAANDGAYIVVGHPDGFMFRDGRTLEPLVYVPHNQALPRSPRGNVMQVLSDNEHIVFRDYIGSLRKLAYRFAFILEVSVAKLTAATLSGIEDVSESAHRWVGFIQLFAGMVEDKKVTPQWELEVEVPHGVGASGEKAVRDDWITKEVPRPKFPRTFGTLPEDTED